MAEPTSLCSDSVDSLSSTKLDRPVSFHYPISAIRKDGHKGLDSGIPQRLSIIYRSKTPSERQQSSLGLEKQGLSHLINVPRDSLKIESNFFESTLGVDNSFIRSKLKMAPSVSTYQQPANHTNLTVNQSQPADVTRGKLSVTHEQSRPTQLQRDISPGERAANLHRKYHSIDKTVKQLPTKPSAAEAPSAV